MKKGWKLLVGIVVLAILGTSYFILKSRSEESEEEEKSQIMDIDSENVEKVSIKNGNFTVTFVKSDDTWKNEEDDSFPVNETSVEEVISSFTDLESDRIIESPEDLEEYQLADAQKSITMELEDGTEYIVYVGLENSSLSQYYIKIGEDTQVYTVDSGVFSFLDQDLYDYAQRDEFPVIASTEIRKVQVNYGENSYQYIYEGEEGSNSSWTVSENDTDYQAADETTVGNVNTSINSFSYIDFINYNCDNKAEYGLDSPAGEIVIDYEVTTTEESVDEESESEEEEENTVTEQYQVKLSVGNEDEEGNYYVCQNDSNEIYTISGDSLDTLFGESYASLLDKTVSYVSLTDMQTLQIISDGTEYSLETREETEETDSDEKDTEDEESNDSEEEDDESSETTVIKYYVNNKEVDSGKFSAFYSVLVGESGQSRNDSISEEGLTSDFELHFTKEDGSVVDVYYYPYNTNFYLAVNGSKKLLVNKMNVKELKEDLVELAQSEE